MFQGAIISILGTNENKSLGKEVKNTKRDQMEISELKNIISKLKNSLNGLHNRREVTKSQQMKTDQQKVPEINRKLTEKKLPELQGPVEKITKDLTFTPL